MGKGTFGFEDPHGDHGEAKMRAASLAPGYLRLSYLIIQLWEACKDQEAGKGKYVGGVGSEPGHYLLRYRRSQAS